MSRRRTVYAGTALTVTSAVRVSVNQRSCNPFAHCRDGKCAISFTFERQLEVSQFPPPAKSDRQKLLDPVWKREVELLN